MDEGLGAGFAQVDAAMTDRATAEATQLTGEEAGLVAAWLTSSDRVQCAMRNVQCAMCNAQSGGPVPARPRRCELRETHGMASTIE